MIEKIITTSTRKPQGDSLKKSQINFYLSACEAQCEDGQSNTTMKSYLG